MQNSEHTGQSKKRPILGAIFTMAGLAVLLVGVWLRTSPSVQQLREPLAAVPTAEVTPLPGLEAVLAEDSNVVQVNRSGFIYPVSMRIPEITLDLPVVIVGLNEEKKVSLPDDSVGFWDASTTLAADGNTVLVGHNNLLPSEVFYAVAEATEGMTIELTSQFGDEYSYTIDDIEIIQVSGADESDYKRIAELMQLEDGRERLTIVSCYPAGSCDSRIILIATPS